MVTRTFVRNRLYQVPTTKTGYKVVDLEACFAGNSFKVFLWPKFKALLECIGITGGGIEINNGVIIFENPRAIADNDARVDAGDEIISLATTGGKEEALVRLAVIITMIYKYQSSGEEGVFKTDGTGNIIGWFKMSSGEVLRILCYWGGNAKGWYFDAHSNLSSGLGAKRRFICVV